MLDLGLGWTILDYILGRLRAASLLEKTYLLTTDRAVDDELSRKARTFPELQVFRGDYEDVGNRFLKAINLFGVSHIVRLTGDNPCIPLEILQKADCGHYQAFDYASNKIGSGYPVGTDVEFFSASSYTRLRSIQGLNSHDREHVTPPYYDSTLAGSFKNFAIHREGDHLTKARLTVDTPEDFRRLQANWNLILQEPMNVSWARLAEIML